MWRSLDCGSVKVITTFERDDVAGYRQKPIGLLIMSLENLRQSRIGFHIAI
jgi:hypothetical protein